MNDLKPAVWLRDNEGTDCVLLERTGNHTRPLYEIPDTHRIVSVELLKRLAEETVYWASKQEIEAIINPPKESGE
ncbi:MAG: hypothetical protein Q8L60_05650 [Gammaproteobacteria bacterium]|nr:hypothetical protein [Gammaproteobacteria bacterium]MDP2346858.1 hypothetical protein [Gammaproteobacteria bacterium]